MPYIKPEDRNTYDDRLDDLCFALEEEGYTEGHVTYVLYVIVARWFTHQPGYKAICRIRGCLIGTMTEFDRRVAAPYEDEKLRENGDVELEYQYNPGRDSEVTTCGTPHPDCEVCNGNS